MAILNVGQTQSILNQGKMEKWTNPAGGVDIESGSFGKLNVGTEISQVGGKSFGEFLNESIEKVNQVQQEANVAIQKLASGENQGIHETMLMVEQAEIAFKTMNQIRTKVLEAYKEVMRMQI